MSDQESERGQNPPKILIEWWKSEASKLSRLTFITGHALRAFQKHHPGAFFSDILHFMSRGVIIDAETALAIAGRSPRQTQSLYVLAPDRQGMFVIQPEDSLRDPSFRRPHTMITYLRFSLVQEKFVIEHWGEPIRMELLPEKGIEEKINPLVLEEEKEDKPSKIWVGEEEGEEWFKNSGLVLYKLEIDSGLLEVFKNKSAFKKAIRRSLSIEVSVDMENWKVRRKLKDPETETTYLLIYRPGAANFAKAVSIEGEEDE